MEKMSDDADPLAIRTYGGRDHVARAAERRQRFVETGIALFGTTGYQATTMRMLTAAAGLTNRYFYESFETMEDLLIACYEKVMADYRARLQTILAAAPDALEAKLRAGTRCFFDEMRDPHFARITQVEVVGVSPRVDALYARSFREFGGLLMQTISGNNGMQSSMSKRELEVIGGALAGTTSFTGAMWMRTGYRDSIETVVEAVVTILIGTARQIQAPR